MRGNKPTAKAKIVKERFVEAMKAKGVTIKALGEMSLVSSATDRDRSEKTIGRYINKGEMPFDLLDHLAQVLDVEPAFLMGKYDIKSFNNPETDEDRRIRERLQAFITPQRFPYALDQMKKVKVDQYYNALLSIHGISLEQFIRLEPEKRFRLMHLIESKLVPILMDFFPVDAQGENGDPNYYELDSQIDNNEEEYALLIDCVKQGFFIYCTPLNGVRDKILRCFPHFKQSCQHRQTFAAFTQRRPCHGNAASLKTAIADYGIPDAAHPHATG